MSGAAGRSLPKNHSLSAKTVHSTVFSCIVFGAVTLLTALTLYTIALTNQYIDLAYSIARQARLSVTHGMDPVPFAEEVMEVYRSLDAEERGKVGTPEYRRHFSGIDLGEKDGAYRILNHLLGGTLDYHNEIYDLYLAMYDAETCALVYIVDPDRNAETRLFPGDWEAVPEREVRRFLSGGKDDCPYDIGWMAPYGWLCTVGAPVVNEDGQSVAFVLVDVSMDNLLDSMHGFVLAFTAAIILLTVIIAWLQARRIKSKLVEPINRIAEASLRFAEGGKTGEGDAEYFADLDIHTGDELENLVCTMSDMEHRLKEYGANLLKITVEKERISTELSLAATIQESMLPHDFPPYPERHEFDIYAMMAPAKEVGGDFYDFFLIDEDRLCLLIADVSGKGIPAALFMMNAKTTLQSCAMQGRSAAEILAKTNEALCANNQAEMFVTVWLGILEISTGRLTAVNAGHEYPVLKRADGGFAVYKDPHSFAVGGMEGIRYKEYELLLKPGDMLFLYTDGIPEASDAAEEMFGTERMLAVLNQHTDAAPEELLRKVQEAVSGFVQEAEQFDDLTMLCIEYKGKA